MSLKQFLLTPVCICCGSFFCGPSLFCNSCYELVLCSRICREAESGPSFDYKHIYLMEWSSDGADEISQLVYRLKGNNSRIALEHYSSLLAFQLKEFIDLEPYSAVVPIPSANKASVHALLLAQNIAKRLKLPLVNPLRKVASVDQKTLTAAERSQLKSIELRAEMSEDFTQPSARRQKYIFVDDVLTTGQSFKQASAAMSNHDSNLIATLFYRSRSGGGLA